MVGLYFSTGGLVCKLLQAHVHGLVWLVCILARWSGLVCKLGTARSSIDIYGSSVLEHVSILPYIYGP